MKVCRVLMCLSVAYLSVVSSAVAQTANPSTKYAWTQPNVATLVIAQGYLYREYVGAATTGTNLADTCVTTPPPATQSADCLAPIPPKAVGTYTVTITTTDTNQNPPAESGKSNAVTFIMQVVPSTPTNLHLVRWLQRVYGGQVVVLSSTRGVLPWHWRRRPLLGLVRDAGRSDR